MSAANQPPRQSGEGQRCVIAMARIDQPHTAMSTSSPTGISPTSETVKGVSRPAASATPDQTPPPVAATEVSGATSASVSTGEAKRREALRPVWIMR